MRIPKMCLELAFSHFKWFLQAILSLTVISNSVSDSSNSLTPIFSLNVSNFVVFFSVFYRKFDEDFKNALKTVIFLLQVSFTEDFVPDCRIKLCFCQLTPIFSLISTDFVVFFYVII